MPYKNLEISSARSVSQTSTKTSQFYKGYSTVNSLQTTKLFDFDLIKQDIINHFNTKKGQRVMNPNFGCIIWDLLMEPMTDRTRDLLKADIERICTSDPRVTPTQMDLTEYPNGYLLEITLVMKGTDQSASMKLAFDQTIGLVVQ